MRTVRRGRCMLRMRAPAHKEPQSGYLIQQSMTRIKPERGCALAHKENVAGDSARHIKSRGARLDFNDKKNVLRTGCARCST